MPSDPPSEVEITVTALDRDRGTRFRSRLRRSHAVAALGLVVAASVTIVLVSQGGGRAPTRSTPAMEARQVAEAFGYPYPMRCLRITTTGEFARAHVVRTGGCVRYRGYLNASFHFIAGHWRLVLDEGQLFVPNALLVGTR